MTDTELREKIDQQLHEIFEQPVVRKQKVDNIMALITSRDASIIREAKIEELESLDSNNQMFGDWQQVIEDRIAELQQTATDTSEQGGEGL